jgi:dTDP-glucose pyrophosphorylase
MKPEDIAAISVDPESTIFDAAEVLNRAHRRLILVVGGDGTLCGIVTDPDIRRAILARMDFQRPVTEIMVRDPITVAPDTAPEEILELMQRTQAHQIPVVDGESRVRDVAFIEEMLAHHSIQVRRTGVIMAGGFGTRLLPLTKTTPKPLLPVGGRPILFTLIDQLLMAGINDVLISVNYHKDQIIDAVLSVGRYARHVRFVEETEPLGTAGSLALLPERPTSPFIVINGDVLTKVAFDAMVRFHQHERNLVTMGLREERSRLPYGVATLDGTRVTGLVEKPEHIHYVNTGVYVLSPQVLDNIPHGQFCDMPTVIKTLLDANRRVGCYPVHEYWMDVGQHAQLEQARDEFQAVFGDGVGAVSGDGVGAVSGDGVSKGSKE